MGQVYSFISSWIWGVPSPSYNTTPDPDTTLSEYDRKLIQMTWAVVADKAVRKKNGVELFMQLFEAYPHMQDMFPSFKDRDMSLLRNDPKMKAHGLSVMFAIGSFVDSMDDPEALVGLIEKLAVSHVERGVTGKFFGQLANMFLPYLDSLLGDSNTQEIKNAWKKLLDLQTSIVTQTGIDMCVKGNNP